MVGIWMRGLQDTLLVVKSVAPFPILSTRGKRNRDCEPYNGMDYKRGYKYAKMCSLSRFTVLAFGSTLSTWELYTFNGPGPETDKVYRRRLVYYRPQALEHGSYIFSSNNTTGLSISIFLSVLTFIVSGFGSVSNLLTIFVLNKSIPIGVSVRESQIALAFAEFLLCAFTGINTIFVILILGNWTRGIAAFFILNFSHRIFLVGRTVTFYQSILISIERYLMVAFPLKSKIWLQRSRRRSIAAFILLIVFSILLNLPWLLKSFVEENEKVNWKTNSTLANFPYLVKRHEYFSTIWIRGSQEIMLGLNSVVPFPILLILKGLLYKAIARASDQRTVLTNGLKKDINSAKMFSVVVIILLSCNIMPIAVYMTSRARMEIYRELILLQDLSVLTGAASNFIVYYAYGKAFQREFWNDHQFFSPSENLTFTYFCKVHGSYLSESSSYDGHLMCVIISALTIFVSLFGVVTNILNVFLLRKSISRGLSFRESLIILAAIEFVFCFFAGTNAFLTICILNNWDRSYSALMLFHISNHVFIVGRTVSFYHSIQVAIERYLMVVAPIQSKIWLYRSRKRSAVGFVVIFILAICMNLPWLTKIYIGQNEVFHWKTNSSLGSYPYLVKRDEYYSKMWSRTFQDVLLVLKSIAPFPLLLILNGLLYISISRWNKRRAVLTGGHQRNIKAAKMFSVVVFILLTCNFMPCVTYITNRAIKELYRELILLQTLSVVTGSAVNFLVYYYFGLSFRREFWEIIGNIKICFIGWNLSKEKRPSHDTNMTDTKI
ncbi:FMRFamide receptor [Orchesella cincta]|uniref:FMRFamide receptor n=1 Tax=Orchesella cincta TaxID=48709 RepID=A0A1D2M9D9_ORCCI|nr:FMRFamide receptor [Orchesella cincta]